MKTSDFYYDLPGELIAQDPLADRSASRLLVLDRKSGEFRHETFRNILRYLKRGDCLVLNDTKVIPARLLGRKKDTGAAIELLLLKRLGETDWECIVRPGKKLRVGAEAEFGDGELTAKVISVDPSGNRIVRFSFRGIFEEVLDRLGQMPLPPYITHELKDRNRYQTVYAKFEGSAAAPTAGLHFTKELLNEIGDLGISLAYVTLHVGLGTFRPVKAEDIRDHVMHEEHYMISGEAAAIVNETKKNGGRVICVGTTSVRTIESAAEKLPEQGGDKPSYGLRACSGDTGIFIYPGYEFKLTDGIITNFHLPESTLIMLVSAFAGREHVLEAYREAVREKYRFFSFGDAMFLTDGIPSDKNA
ncbi:MAG: tRNA preQ1(34) S-adenosylmethionine ribosyltransferase-isomerase QueA [Lachnospiraceae bacterium]|nr:tRNA preQ1(34) S-adenosylmethionine ribosyltransferase-isomerase QueA [Lachnospiraceae bacterium]